MSFYSDLIATYENCKLADVSSDNRPLPPFFTRMAAQLEVVIDWQGHFKRAQVIEDKKNQQTIIPSTEGAMNRTSKPVPFPLFDNLSYIAGDAKKYFPQVSEDRYHDYITQLGRVAERMDYLPVTALYSYLKKGCLCQDLEQAGIIQTTDSNGKDKKISIKGVADPDKAFVRFRVEVPEEKTEPGSDERLWMDRVMWKRFDPSMCEEEKSTQVSDLCYVTGKKVPLAAHGSKGIMPGQRDAKIISGLDKSGFVYHGRFLKDTDCFQIGGLANEKMTNTLNWLLRKQGTSLAKGQYFVAWGTRDEKVPDVFSSLVDLGLAEESAGEPYTDYGYAQKLRAALQGYSEDLQPKSEVSILGMDTATKGRISIIYYRHLSGEEYLDRFVDWSTSCRWILICHGKDGKGKSFRYEGSPSVREIIRMVLGKNPSDSAVNFYQRELVSCIVDNIPFPMFLAQQAFENASNPPKYPTIGEYKEALGIACAVISKYHTDKNRVRHTCKEVCKVGLDTSCTDRSYLFGRLLACADNAESYSQYLSGEEQRQTNAMRYMRQFSLKPAKTWEIIWGQLDYYFKKMGEGRAHSFKKEMNEIVDKIGISGFNDEKLSPIFLLGFSSQENEFENKKATKKQGEANNV